MASLDHLRELMKEIGPLLQLHEVHEDLTDSRWLLAWPDGIVVAVDYIEDEHRITLSTDAGEMPEDDDAATANLLLAYNYQWPETGGVRTAVYDKVLFLVYDLFAIDLDVSRFSTVLTNFAGKSRVWGELLERRRSSPGVESDANSLSDIQALEEVMRMGIRA